MAGDKRQKLVQRIAARSMVPLLLGIMILFGGASAPGLKVHYWLQLLGLGVIAVCLWNDQLFSIPKPARRFLWVAGAWGVYLLIQLLPLPAGLRRALPGGEDIARGYEAIGVDMPMTPLSLAPAETFAGLLMIIPPLAIFLLMSKLSWRSNTAAVKWALPAFAVASVMLGLMQMSTDKGSLAYFYTITNYGYPVGTFANINHQAMFLLMTIPFLASEVGVARVAWSWGDREPTRIVAIAAMSLIILMGIVLAGSMAGYGLILPTLLMTVTLIFGRRRFFGIKWRYAIPLFTVIGLAISFWGILPLLNTVGMEMRASSDLSRRMIWLTSLGVLQDYWLLGAGIGSFPQVYAIYEQATAITNVYANHAHNDYLEWFIELGLFGAAICAAFLAMAAWQTFEVWKMPKGDVARLKRAASIAFWLPFVHSLVEFPLRTPALACFAAACLAIMIVPAERSVRARRAEKATSERLSRQVEI